MNEWNFFCYQCRQWWLVNEQPRREREEICNSKWIFNWAKADFNFNFSFTTRKSLYRVLLVIVLCSISSSSSAPLATLFSLLTFQRWKNKNEIKNYIYYGNERDSALCSLCFCTTIQISLNCYGSLIIPDEEIFRHVCHVSEWDDECARLKNGFRKYGNKWNFTMYLYKWKWKCVEMVLYIKARAQAAPRDGSEENCFDPTWDWRNTRVRVVHGFCVEFLSRARMNEWVSEWERSKICADISNHSSIQKSSYQSEIRIFCYIQEKIHSNPLSFHNKWKQ